MRCLFILAFFLFSQFSIGQKFHLDFHSGLNFNQVDGDNLRGFNDVGLNVGLKGGYAIMPNHWLVTGFSFQQFGANRKDERLSNQSVNFLLESQMNAAFVSVGYDYNFGDDWSGINKYSLQAGMKYGFILNNEINILKSDHLGIDYESELNQRIDDKLLGYYISFSRVLSKNFAFSAEWYHTVTNLVNEPIGTIGTLKPYTLSFNFHYHISKIYQ